MAENIFQCCTACCGSMRYGTNAGEMSTVLELQKLLDANTSMDYGHFWHTGLPHW